MATAALTWPCPYSRPVFRAAPRYVSACWPAVLCVCCGLSEMKFMASVLRPCKRSISVSLSLCILLSLSGPFAMLNVKVSFPPYVSAMNDASKSTLTPETLMLLLPLWCCCCAVAAVLLLLPLCYVVVSVVNNFSAQLQQQQQSLAAVGGNLHKRGPCLRLNTKNITIPMQSPPFLLPFPLSPWMIWIHVGMRDVR